MADPNMSLIILPKAADYYHQCLLNNKKEYEYLQKTLLRSEEIIERFELGFSDGNVTKYLLSKGYELGDIIVSGLARKNGTDFIKAGNFIYPYIVDDIIFCFGYKKKDSRYTKKTIGKNLSIFYNQDEVNNIVRGLFIVQDEDSLISVLDRDKYMTNTVSVSGYVTDEHIKMLKSKGYEFLKLIFNNDYIGQKNLEKMVEAFRGTTTKLVQIKFGKNCITFNDYVRNSLYSDALRGTKSIAIGEAKRVGFILEQEFTYVYLSEKDEVIKPITNFLIDIVNRIVHEDGTVKREVQLKNEVEVSELFVLEPSNMPTAKDFSKFCFSQGNFIFKGSTKELNELWDYLFSKDTGRKIYLLMQVGYIAKFDLYLFDNIAIKNSEVIVKDKNGVFWLNELLGIKIDPISKYRILPRIKIPEKDFNFLEYINNVISALNRNVGGYKGSLVIGYIVATIYSFEIHRRFGFFPILFIYGKFKSGKNIMCSLIMEFFGLKDSETSIHENSQTAVSRLLSFISYLPNWIDEYKASDKKIKAMDGFFRSAYNKVSPIKALKDDTGIREIPVRGNLILSGEEMPTDPALRSRCFPINLSMQERKDEVYPEVIEMSKDFSEITSHLILNKSQENIKNLLNLISDNKSRFISAGFDSRQAEVYSVIASGYEFLYKDEGFMNWLENLMKQESEKREEESTVNNFWSDVEGILKTERLSSRDYFSISRKQNKVYIWFAELYRIVERSYRQRKSDFLVSKQTILDQLSEEPYFVDKGITKMIGEDRRNCIVLDLEKSPDCIKTICEVIGSESAG